MWKEEILQYLYGMSLIEEDGHWKELEHLVSLAPEIYFGKIEDWLDLTKKYVKKDLPTFVYLPFDVALVEWIDNRLGGSEETHVLTPKRVVLVHSKPEIKEQTLYAFYYGWNAMLSGVPLEDKNKEESMTWRASYVSCKYTKDKEEFIDWNNIKQSGVPDFVFKMIIQEDEYDFIIAKLLLNKQYHKPEKCWVA